MIAYLPQALEVDGEWYDIDSDFRTALLIMQMYNDRALSIYSQHATMLNILFTVLDEEGKPVTKIPKNTEQATIEAIKFLNIGQEDTQNDIGEPKVLDYEKDAQLLFSEVNAVWKREVRLEPYMHWWTFYGLCQKIDSEGFLAYIIQLRTKIAKKEKLSKEEKEFIKENEHIIIIEDKESISSEERRKIASERSELIKLGRQGMSAEELIYDLLD